MESNDVGLKYHIVGQLLDDFEAYFGGRFNSLSMFELGCQQIRQLTFPLKHPATGFCTAKEYFESLGMEHVSVDMNGLYGAIPLDLSVPVERPGWNGHFDVATNFGTIEHIDQNEFQGQWQVFKTMHDCVKPGGMMLHTLPECAPKTRHCFFTYATDFPARLAEANGYKIRVNSAVGGALIVSYVKLSDAPFMSAADFGTKIGVIRSPRIRR